MNMELKTDKGQASDVTIATMSAAVERITGQYIRLSDCTHVGSKSRAQDPAVDLKRRVARRKRWRQISP